MVLGSSLVHRNTSIKHKQAKLRTLTPKQKKSMNSSSCVFSAQLLQIWEALRHLAMFPTHTAPARARRRAASPAAAAPRPWPRPGAPAAAPMERRLAGSKAEEKESKRKAVRFLPFSVYHFIFEYFWERTFYPFQEKPRRSLEA